MNWDAIGSLGQIVGAIGVIISLGYLAIQLKQNGLATQHASQNMFVAEYNRYMEHLYSNPQILELIQRATFGGGDLSFVGDEQFHLILAQHNLLCFNVFLQLEAKQFSPRIANGFFTYFAAILKTPRPSAWWQLFRPSLGNDAYAHYIDSLIADPDQSTLEQIQPGWSKARSSPSGPM